jgi:hypothetical protein
MERHKQMSAIMKNIVCKHIILLCLIFLGITGCASKTNIEANFDDGISMVILPNYNTGISTMHWAKIGSNASYSFSFSHAASKLGIYFILPIEAGTYYIKSISVQSIGGFDPIYANEYNSIFGDIVLEKTPEQVVSMVMDESKKKFTTKQVIEPVASYYKFDYEFNDTLPVTITINPHEIALIPAVWIDAVLKQDSCKPFSDNRRDSFIRQLARDYVNPIDMLFGITSSNGLYAWHWTCPIKELVVNTKSASLDEFVFFAKTRKVLEPIGRDFVYILIPQAYRKFPEYLFEKITVKNFELSKIFKNAKIKTLDDGTEQYIIYGNADEEQKDSD